MPTSDPAHTLLAAALDAGDRLVAACTAGDLDAAGAALTERAGHLAALVSSPRPQAMPQALVIRFHAQDACLSRALNRQLHATECALATAGRTSAAHARYHAVPAAPRLDTAPR